MSLRVNLMKQGELRHSGALRRSFLIRTGIGAVSAILILAVVIMVVKGRNASSQLEKLKLGFKDIEPLYNEIKVVQQNLAVNRKLIDELDGWNHSRIEWHKVLMDYQGVVPGTVQLESMDISSSLTMLEAPRGTENPPPPVPIRTYRLFVAGKVVDKLANEVIVRFVQTLRKDAAFRPFFKTVKLQRMEKDTSAKVVENQHSFAVESVSVARKME